VFRQLGLNIDLLDGNGATPMHWACYCASDTAIYYLNSWSCDVNIKDHQGNTPLHIAVCSAHKFSEVSNLRAIKELLIKGANRDLKNKEGQKPIDLALTIEDLKLRERVAELLGRDSVYLPCCHLRQPLRKVERSRVSLYAYLLLHVGTFLLLKTLSFSGVQNAVLTTGFTASLIFFGLTASRDPGYVHANDEWVSFADQVDRLDPNSLCPRCELPCQPSSKHCYICERCVARYDHHCNWVDNCIGDGNYSWFLAFVFTQTAYMIMLTIFLWLYIDNHSCVAYLVLAELACFLPCLLVLVKVQILNLINRQTTKERLGTKNYREARGSEL
jgi:hypothetical protein